MQDKTAIIRDDVPIAEPRNISVEVLDLSSNANIFFLPVGVAEAFPDLKDFQASSCYSISKIFKKNFLGLSKLEGIFLSRNFIQTIPSNTFEGLQNLRRISLGKNL